MKNILILGNGISRLLYKSTIDGWSGPVWGCNRIFFEYGDRLEYITGHVEIMTEAVRYRKENNLSYKIIGGIGGGKYSDEKLISPKKYHNDSGTTLAAEALCRGHDIFLCGFDMGGKDVHSPGHETQNKSVWVSRWRKLLADFGEERIHFIGHDHKPFLLSGQPENIYAENYRFGKPHIPGEKYRKLEKEWISGDPPPVKMVLLENRGKREWNINGILLKSKNRAFFPEGYALKYIELYPKDFLIIKEQDNGENEADDLEQRKASLESEKC